MSDADLMYFAQKADSIAEEPSPKESGRRFKSDALFAGLVGVQAEEAQMAPMSAQMAKTFVRMENVKAGDGEQAIVKGAYDLSDPYELQMFQGELGTNSTQIKIMPLSTSSDGECFTEGKDYGNKLKKHLDYLCEKYEIVAVPREITGFSTYSCNPDGYVPVQVHGKCMYSSTGIKQMNLLEDIVDRLKQELASRGTAKVSLLKSFKTGIKEIGIAQTLLVTLDEIMFLAETFAGYNPCLAETTDDYILLINPTTIPTELM